MVTLYFFRSQGNGPPVYTQYAINYRRSFAIVKNLLVSFLTLFSKVYVIYDLHLELA
jgi:hypothetical protein